MLICMVRRAHDHVFGGHVRGIIPTCEVQRVYEISERTCRAGSR